jgi:hypothetical protein
MPPARERWRVVGLRSLVEEEANVSTHQHAPYQPYHVPLRTTDELAAWVEAALLAVVLFSGAAIIATILALMVLL